MRAVSRYLRRVWLALNQLTNTLAGGQPDETLSARSGRTRDRAAAGDALCDIFEFAGDPEHCERAIENERRGRSQDPAYGTGPFMTRRAALQLAALSPLFLLPSAEDRVLDLDRPITVRRGGAELVIDPDAMWHALEAAITMPLARRK